MNWLASRSRWIMLIGGALTCTMFYVVIAPDASLQSNFGESLTGPAAAIVVRNWGALIGIVGLMLIYGAFTPAVRSLVLMVGAASKTVFIALVLTFDPDVWSHGVRVAVLADAVFILLFVAILVGTVRDGDQTRPRS